MTPLTQQDPEKAGLSDLTSVGDIFQSSGYSAGHQLLSKTFCDGGALLEKRPRRDPMMEWRLDVQGKPETRFWRLLFRINRVRVVSRPWLVVAGVIRSAIDLDLGA